MLTVEGASRIHVGKARARAAVGTLMVLLVTVPITVHMLVWVPTGFNNYRQALIQPGESRAIAYLARQSKPGSVLSNIRLGAIIPEATGRNTYLGNWAWSVPGFRIRSQNVVAFFSRPITSASAQRFVREIGVRYVLSPCGARPGIKRALGPMLASTHTFGCATVYSLRPHD